MIEISNQKGNKKEQKMNNKKHTLSGPIHFIGLGLSMKWAFYEINLL